MAIIGAQPFNAFISGRQARQTEDYNNTRNALSQFELSQAPVQAENQNKLAQLQITGAQQGIDQRAAQFSDSQRRDALTQALSAAEQVRQNPASLASMPEAFKSRAMQELGQSAQDPQAVSQWAQGLAGNIKAQLGMQPAAPVPQMETIQGPDGSLLQRDPVTGAMKEVLGRKPRDPAPEKGPNAPAGYRYKPDGTLEPIPGGPAANDGSKITDTQRQAAAYAARMKAASDRIDGANYVPTASDLVAFNYIIGQPGVRQSMANKYLKPEARQYFQSLQDFSRAKLRKESGAVISKEEISGDLATFFPLPGDDAATIEQKKQARAQALNGMIESAGNAYSEPPQQAPADQGASGPRPRATNPKTGQVVEFDGQKWVPVGQ